MVYKHPNKRYNLLTILYVADTLDNCGKREVLSEFQKLTRFLSSFFFSKNSHGLKNHKKITKSVLKLLVKVIIDYLSS